MRMAVGLVTSGRRRLSIITPPSQKTHILIFTYIKLIEKESMRKVLQLVAGHIG